MFLMHRVELKEKHPVLCLQHPNLFLMHRVELKVYQTREEVASTHRFLMHRVELKDASINLDRTDRKVPNAPCGVERLFCMHWRSFAPFQQVPNAPCGVESSLQKCEAFLGATYFFAQNLRLSLFHL